MLRCSVEVCIPTSERLVRFNEQRPQHAACHVCWMFVGRSVKGDGERVHLLGLIVMASFAECHETGVDGWADEAQHALPVHVCTYGMAYM